MAFVSTLTKLLKMWSPSITIFLARKPEMVPSLTDNEKQIETKKEKPRQFTETMQIAKSLQSICEVWIWMMEVILDGK